VGHTISKDILHSWRAKSGRGSAAGRQDCGGGRTAAEWQQGGGDRSAVVGGRRHESGRAAGERRRQESSRVAAAGERLESGGDRRVELMRTLMSCPAGRPAGCPLGERLQASCPPLPLPCRATNSAAVITAAATKPRRLASAGSTRQGRRHAARW